MKKPKASFVIPVYNGQAFLADTIKSCLIQSQPRFEIIVVDDGSTDETEDILTHFQYTDERVKVIRLEKNEGRSVARNRGIESAESDIIMTLDSDDICIPDRVEKTLKFFKKNPAVDIMYSDCHDIDAQGDIIVYQNKEGKQGIDIVAQAFDYELVKKSLKTFIPCHSSMSFKKHVFDKVRYMEGEWSKHGIDDWRFQVDAHLQGFKFGFINTVLVQYRRIDKPRDEKRIAELKKSVLV